MRYTVEVKEVWTRTFDVELPDDEATKALVGGRSLGDRVRDAANKKIEAGDDDQGFEYSDTRDPGEWNVRTEDGDYLP
jgi:hypothetical protein